MIILFLMHSACSNDIVIWRWVKIRLFLVLSCSAGQYLSTHFEKIDGW